MSTELENEEDTGTSKKMDPELRVMGAMLRLLDNLDEHAKCRVVLWLSDRYVDTAGVSEDA